MVKLISTYFILFDAIIKKINLHVLYFTTISKKKSSDGWMDGMHREIDRSIHRSYRPGRVTNNAGTDLLGLVHRGQTGLCRGPMDGHAGGAQHSSRGYPSHYLVLYQAGGPRLCCVTTDPTISLTSSNKDFSFAHPVCPSRLTLVASLQPPH